MVMRLLRNIISCLTFTFLFYGHTIGQFENINDTIVCHYFILPVPDGMNLSFDIKYYDQTNAQGQSYNIGDTVFYGTQLFVYDGINGFEECFFVTVIQNPPEIDFQGNISVCHEYILPKISGDNIGPWAAYYTKRNGQGIRLYPRARITTTTKFYVYDGIDQCFSEDSLEINIVPHPYLFIAQDIEDCNPYQLGDIEGVDLPFNRRYRDILTGDIYFPGDIINQSGVLELIADTINCIVRDTISIKIRETPFISDINDITACGKFVLDFDFINSYVAYDLDSIYYTITKSSSPVIKGNIRNELSTSTNAGGILCLIDSIPGTTCVAKSCFNLTINPIDTFWQIKSADTIIACNNAIINMYTLLNVYYSEHGYIIEADESLDFNGIHLDPTGLSPGYYGFDLIKESHPACMFPNNTVSVVLHLADQCFDSKKIWLETECDETEQIRDYIREEIILFGGTVYNEDFTEVFGIDDHILRDETDTLIYYYVLNKTASPNDTVTMCLTPWNQVEIYPSQIIGSTSLCYGEISAVIFNDNLTSDKLFWDFEIWERTLSLDISLGTFGGFGQISTITFGQEFDVSFNCSNISVNGSNKEYYIVYRDLYFIPDSNECFNYFQNNEPDTVFFNTLDNTFFLYDDILCPNEEIVIEGEVFNFDNSYGEITLTSAAHNGCDSIIEVSLDFIDKSEKIINLTYCDEDEFIYLDCKRFDINNRHDTIVYEGASHTGCDSLVIVNLTYHISVADTSILEICHGNSLSFNGISYGADDSFIDTIKTEILCDSIYRQYNVVNNAISISIDTVLCSGEILNLNGIVYDMGGEYNQTLETYDFCDSVRYSLTLDIKPDPLQESISLESCHGDSVEFNQTYYSNPGFYTDTIRSAIGCDSAYYDITIVLSPESQDSLIDITLCPDESWSFMGQEYSVPGIYLDTLFSTFNCDSIHYVIDLDFIESEIWEINNYYMLCDGEEFTIELGTSVESAMFDNLPVEDVIILDQEGTYLLELYDFNGCLYEYILDVEMSTGPTVSTQDLTDIIFENNISLPVSYEGSVVSYNWTPPAAVDCYDCPYPMILSNEDQVYTIEVIDDNGCRDTAQINVSFLEQNYYIPNVVTTEGLTSNSVFYASGNTAVKYDMKIYDRWGNLIYHADKLDINDPTHGWNPSQNLVRGVYVYLIKFYDHSKMNVVSGDITVL